MDTTTLITQREYDRTVFEHDAEYVEGRIVHRAMPTPPHSALQAFLVYILYVVARPLGFEVLPELRIRTRADRTRIPDVCLTHGMPSGVPDKPPFLCIEILSPEDSIVELRTKIAEYLAMGVEFVWVTDPEDFTGEIHARNGIERVTNGLFRAGTVEVDVREMSKRR